MIATVVKMMMMIMLMVMLLEDDKGFLFDLSFSWFLDFFFLCSFFFSSRLKPKIKDKKMEDGEGESKDRVW